MTDAERLARELRELRAELHQQAMDAARERWREGITRDYLERQQREAAAQPPLTPPAPVEIDYDALCVALASGNHMMSVRLVRFMADRATASYVDVLEGVYDGSDRGWGTVKVLVNRTNNRLAALTGPVAMMARRLKFRAADLTVLRIIGPM